MIRRSVRSVFSGSLVLACFFALATGASAQTKKPDAPKPKVQTPAPVQTSPGQGVATLIGTFGNWEVYASDTPTGRVCYALSRPKDRQPAGLTRDQAYFFVSTRPKENVRDEVSFVLGFPPKEGADGQLVLGKTTFTISTKVQGNAWLKSPQDDPAVVEQMKKVPQVVLKLTSKRGNALTDTYATAGFVQALDQVKKVCP